MNTISAEAAFLAYEAVRHRLPEIAPSAEQYRRVATLQDLFDDFDVFLLDAFGVLNIGETAIAGVPERVKALKADGKKVLVVSNAAGASHADLIAKYRRLGYDFAPDEVITSRATLLSGLNGRQGLHWGLMASRDSGLRDLEDLTLTYLEDDPAPYGDVDGFLLIGATEWSEARQEHLEQALRDHPRPVLVGNPDIVAPREYGFSTEPGYYAHRLADRTNVQPEFFGKPFANIYELALNRLGPVDKSRILMVGDSLHTDVLGARTAGIASALIANFGFFAGQDIAAAIARAEIVPDYVVSQP